MRKILSAALALVCIWFATPSRAALPSGYTQLEYIESTGTQYIDTGFSPDANTRVDYKGQLLQYAPSVPLLGARLGADNPARFLPLAWKSGANTGRTVYGDKDVELNISTSTIYTGTFNPAQGKTIINGITYDISGGNFAKMADNNFYLFATSGYVDNLYNSVGRIWYVKIWDNNTLVRDMVPAKNASGKIGMYDTVNNRFYTNAGTGEFIAGDPVTENNTCTKNGFGFANESIIYNVGANFLDNYSAESGRRLTYSDETAVCAVTGSGSASNGFIGSQTVVFTSGHKYATIAYLNATGRFNIGLTRISPSDSVTGGTSSSMQEATNGWTWSALPLNAVVDGTAVINARISTGVLQVKEMYLIDLTALFGAGNEPTTKSEIIAAFTTNPCPSSIKIATTKYNETAFGPLNTALQNAISVVDTVVTQTITQAENIATLQTQKQTRPADDPTDANNAENCPAGKKCLLVEDASGIPHWYEIFDPIHWFLDAFFVKNPNGQYEENGKDFRRWQGNPYFRKTYIDGSTSVYVRQWTAATPAPARRVGGMYQTLSEGDLENAGTWAVEYDGTEAEGINAGVMYGIAKCTSVAGTYAKKLPAESEAKFYELPAPVGQPEREGYERESFKQCWCRASAVGVPGDDGDPANGSIYPVGASSWVFNRAGGSAADCAYGCASYCARNVRNDASFRSAVFGGLE